MQLRKFAIVIALAAMGSFAMTSSAWAGICKGDADGDGLKDGNGAFFDGTCKDTCDNRADTDNDGIPDCDPDPCDDTTDADEDGVSDCIDACPGSSLSPTVVVGTTCDSGAPDSADAVGCTLNDQAEDCLAGFDDRECRLCVKDITQDAVDEGRLTGGERKAIINCGKNQC